MKITVKLHAALRRYRPTEASGALHQSFALTVAPSATVLDLLASLAIPEGMVNGAAINGEVKELTTRLEEGDTLHLFPPSAGG